MPRIRVPQSDAGRVHLLGKSLQTAATDKTKGVEYLPEDLVAEIGLALNDRQENGETVPGFASLIAERAKDEGLVTKETEESQAAEELLEVNIRDYIDGLVRRTFRLKHSAAVLDFHGLDHAGTTPVLASREDRRTVANQLIAGDATAVSKGFPAMSNPSAAELSAALASAEKEAAEIVPADRELQNVVEKIRAARPQIIALVDDVIEELQHGTRKMEPGTAREIMRSYGVTFDALPGETPDPAPAPTPTPAPAPAAPAVQ